MRQIGNTNYYAAAKKLKNNRFGVLAKDAPQGVGNFADCGEGFHGGSDGRQQVFACLRAGLDCGNCCRGLR